jgi:hypothetical protein
MVYKIGYKMTKMKKVMRWWQKVVWETEIGVEIIT